MGEIKIEPDLAANMKEEIELLKISTEIQIKELKELRSKAVITMEGRNLVDYAFFRYIQDDALKTRHMTRENYNEMIHE